MAKIKGQLEDAQLHNKSSDPSNLPDGLFWLNTTSNVMKAYIGAATRTILTADQTQTVSNKTYASPVFTGVQLGADGSSSAPAYSFSSDTNTGLYRVGADDLSIVAGSYVGLDVKKSTGNFANIGMGGISASVSDSYPLLIERTVAGAVIGQISNPSSDSTASAKIQLSVDAGDKLGELAVYPNEATTAAYTSMFVVRPNGNAAGLSLIGGDLATGFVTFFTAGDYASTGEALRVNADKTIQFMQTVSGPASPSAGLKLYNESNALKSKNSGGTVRQYATLDGTEDLTNKTITSATIVTPTVDVATLDGQGSTPSNPSAGYYKMYVSDTTNKLTLLDSAGTATTVGSGGTGINYITNGDAEGGTTGWATYADAAGTSPVDGTGGIPSATWTTSSSSPLYGANSFLLTKGATNRQGDGASFAFTVSPAHFAKVMQISFDYIVSSGTFVAGTSSADSDVTVWIYDVTNSTLIQPSSYKLLSNSSTIADRFNATFQTSAAGTSYRLIVHIGSTSASAYTLKFDNISVSPSTYVYGTPITDWQSYTPTGNWTTNTTYTGYWRRVGDSMQVNFKVATSGAPGGTSTWTLNLPSGYTIDTSKLADSTQYNKLGILSILDSGVQNYPSFIVYSSTTAVAAELINAASTNLVQGSSVTATSPMTFGASDYVTGSFQVPISGWSSSVQTSDQTDTRVVAALVTGDPASASSGNPIIVPTVSYDSHSAYNASTGRYTCPVPGIYKVFGALQSASSATTLTIYKNAVSTSLAGSLDSNGEATFNSAVNCSAGDIIDLRPGGTVDATSMTLNFERISGPSQIAANELVAFKYQNTAATAITGSFATVPFATKVWSTHGDVVSSGVFTAPIAGTYEFTVSLYASITLSTSQSFAIQWLVTSGPEGLSASTQVGDNEAGNGLGSNTAWAINETRLYKLNAGDTVAVQMFSDGTGALTLSSAAGRNVFSGRRVGL